MENAYVYIGCKDRIGKESQTYCINEDGKQISPSFNRYFEFVKWTQSLPHGIYWKAEHNIILPR